MSFSGFRPETFEFLTSLSRNNDKVWFENHADEYQEWVKKPSVDFVNTMGELLQVLDPGIKAIPKVNQSLFKIYRDTRFSENKLPLKDHVGILFWSGSRKRMECSGFYLHMEPDMVYLGCGVYCFSNEILPIYRRAIQNPNKAKKLSTILQTSKDLGYQVGGKALKKIPRGMDPDMICPELALYKGLYAGTEFPPSPKMFSDDLLPFAFDHYKTLLPLHEWLLSILN